MKRKLFFLFVSMAVCLSLHAQTDSETLNKLFVKCRALNDTYTEFYQQKDYVNTVKTLRTMLQELDKLQLTKAEQEKYQELVRAAKNNSYYNLACSYALQNKKKEAIEAFKKSIEYGYKDYRHALTDTDFDGIRNDKRFKQVLETIREYDYLYILRHAKGYRKEATDTLPRFTYQQADDHSLKQMRTFFKLDSVAGNGDEVSKIINILKFVHNSIPHDGGNFGMCEGDAFDIYNYYKATGNGVNCRQLAIALNGMYLAMGFPSRYVTCMPKDENDGDCHVINCVYSSKLNKWLWMDPTFNAYVKDEHGNLLSIAEVRERLITDQPLYLNEDANWNNKSKQTKEKYLDDYMAKNLYWMNCVDNSCLNPEGRYRYYGERYIVLLPEGFSSPATVRSFYTVTNDADYFWQKPPKEGDK
ncbi:TPR end-of-group domain-containing protein [Hoylesella oralis]|uniref:TPR end-of-group domain-containing protein n=1 Tax=Hoylesella oralis TaxID=28134 RepID=UPI003619FDC0